MDPGRWAGAEEQLAELARIYRPDELAGLAAKLVEELDQDGAEPADEPDEVNELHLTKNRDGSGGRVKGQLDAATLEVLARAIQASLLPPVKGEDKSLASARRRPR